MATFPRVRPTLTYGFWFLAGTVLCWDVGHLLLDDDAFAFVAWHTLAPLLIAPVLVLLALALTLRRAPPLLAALALLLVWLFDNLPGTLLGPTPASGQPCMTITYANVLSDNGYPDRIGAELLAHPTDTLFLAEYNPAIAKTIAPAVRHWPVNHPRPAVHNFGYALFSSRSGTVHEVDLGGTTLVRLETQCEDRTLTVFGVHTIPPLGAGLTPVWRDNLERLTAIIRETRGPVIAIGDFNATRHHPSFRRLLADTGLVPAHTRFGRAHHPSWPNGNILLPVSLFRIDHALVSDEVRVHALSDGIGTGSDHAPIRIALSW